MYYLINGKSPTNTTKVADKIKGRKRKLPYLFYIMINKKKKQKILTTLSTKPWPYAHHRKS